MKEQLEEFLGLRPVDVLGLDNKIKKAYAITHPRDQFWFELLQKNNLLKGDFVLCCKQELGLLPAVTTVTTKELDAETINTHKRYFLLP